MLKKNACCAFLISISIFLFGGCYFSPAENSLSDGPAKGIDPCLLFQSLEEGTNGVFRICPESKSELLFSKEEFSDFTVSQNGDLFFLSRINQLGGIDFWSADRNGKSKTFVYTCEQDPCSIFAIDPTGMNIYFSRSITDPFLMQYNMDQDEEIIIEYGRIDFVDLSPNGKYLRYHLKDKDLVRVLDLEDMELVLSFQADVDLIGSWSPDSGKFLLGQRNTNGDLMVSAVTEICVESMEDTLLFELPAGTEYSQATYITKDTILVLARIGIKNNTKQILEVDMQGNIIRNISDQPVYDHSAIKWDPTFGKLALQRYDVTSSKSTPEIWIWKRKADSYQKVAENAFRPFWQY